MSTRISKPVPTKAPGVKQSLPRHNAADLGSTVAQTPLREYSKDDFKISDFEIYKAIDQDNSFQMDEGSSIGVYMPEERLDTLGLIENFVNECMLTTRSAFREGARKVQGSLCTYFPAMHRLLSARRPFYRYSAKVELFFTTCEELPHWRSRYRYGPMAACEHCGRPRWELYNELVDKLRAQTKTRAFKKRLSNEIDASTKRFNSMSGYVDQLFLSAPQLLVAQLDIGYRAAYREQVDVAEAKRNLNHFLNNGRHNAVFEHLFGYIWKLEYGDGRKYHFNLTLFFSDSLLGDPAQFAQSIGNYWSSSILKGNGLHFSSERHQMHRFKRLGAARVSADDEAKRADLRLALEFLAREDQFLKRADSLKVSQSLQSQETFRERMWGKAQQLGSREARSATTRLPALPRPLRAGDQAA